MNTVTGGIDFNIPADYAACRGHFPGFPVVPGAVLLDEIFGRLEAALGIDVGAYRLLVAKFPAPVSPGRDLSLEYRMTEPGTIHFTLAADGKIVATGSLSPRQSG